MGAYPTIAKWGIVAGLKKIGKRREAVGQAPPYMRLQRQLWLKKKLDCTLIRTGKSRLRKRSASWRSRRRSGRRPRLRRREWCRERRGHLALRRLRRAERLRL